MSDVQKDLSVHPVSWSKLRMQRPRYWLDVPQWAYLWIVFWSQQWSFLRILDAAGKFVIVVALFQWFSESGNRVKERHYRAWDIVNSARGSTGDGGRRDALQDLNNDGVALANAPLSDAYLIGINLSRAMLNGASLKNANLAGAQLQGADLGTANLVNANLIGANLSEANLVAADLTGANLHGASLFKADLKETTIVQTSFCQTLMPDGTTNNKNCQAAPQGPKLE
jgi:hypothetical protein